MSRYGQSDMSLEAVARKARRIIQRTVVNEGVPGKLGAVDGTLYFTDKNGVTHRDQVWVRMSTEATQTEIVAYCTAVNPLLHLPVRVADRERGPEVIGVDRGLSGSFTGGRMTDVPRHWWTHLWLGPDPAFLDSRSFMGLGVRPSDPPALTVDIKAGFYRWEGELKAFPDTTSSSLSAYLPAGSAVNHFVILCLDRPNNALVVVDGNDKLASEGAINQSDITAVNVVSSYFPLAAIRLRAGQSEIRLPDIIHDVRPWGGDTMPGESSASGGWTVDYDAIIPGSKDAFIPGTVSVQSGSTLTVDGDLYIV